MVDVANQRLNPKHPETFIPYSEYLEMIGAGVFGQDAENFPLPTASWLVTIDDSLEWLASKGLTIDFDTLKAKVELIRGHSRPQTLKVENEQECQAEELGRVSDAPATIREWDIHNLRRLLDESREPGSTHQKLGEQYGVTRQRIGALLKKAKADFSPQRSTTWASSLKIK